MAKAVAAMVVVLEVQQVEALEVAMAVREVAVAEAVVMEVVASVGREALPVELEGSDSQPAVVVLTEAVAPEAAMEA